MTREELIKYTEQQEEIGQYTQMLQSVTGWSLERAAKTVFRRLWAGHSVPIFCQALAIGLPYRQAARLAAFPPSVVDFVN